MMQGCQESAAERWERVGKGWIRLAHGCRRLGGKWEWVRARCKRVKEGWGSVGDGHERAAEDQERVTTWWVGVQRGVAKGWKMIGTWLQGSDERAREEAEVGR